MKKKIDILTCVNEDGTVVSANVFTIEKAASDAMEAQFQAEKEDAISCGWEEDDFDFANIDEDFAEIKYGSSEYYWMITEEEITDGYADSAQALLKEYNGGACENRVELLAKAMELLERIAKYSRLTIGE